MNMFGKSDKAPDLEFFTVFDTKAQIYSEPFPFMNREVALREFTLAFKDPAAGTKNRYYINSEDFKLFKIANFDFKQGVMTPVPMEHVVNFHDLRSMVDTEPKGH